MATYSTQYRPLVNVLTGEPYPLCTAYHRIGRENANVLQGRVAARKVLEVVQFDFQNLPANVAESYVFQAIAPARRGYTTYDIRLWARDSVAGPGTTFRIRTDRAPYLGSGAAGAFDATALTDAAQVVAIALDGTGVARWYEASVGIVSQGVADPWCWVVVTTQIPGGGSPADFGELFMEYKVLS